jgi:DNA polymerase I-like protein with 3'-5' exonuclease and polymerase domains
MIRCHRHVGQEYGGKVKMILTLHDELQFEVQEEVVPTFIAELPGLMCDVDLSAFGLRLPLAVEIKCGRSWGELQPWKGRNHGDLA